MKSMSLDDLINLLWSALEMDRGGELFFRNLEGELAKRVRGIKDEQFETLLQCFTGENADNNKFSEKFMKLVLLVIREKKDRFALRTLVQVIWSCAKIDFTNDNFELVPLLKEFAAYERLTNGLQSLYQKSQAILLWTYTRDERLLRDEQCQKFIHQTLDALVMFPDQFDNFDLTLIVQSITNVRNAKCNDFMQKLFVLAQRCDAVCLQQIPKMSIHEFVTITQFYLQNSIIASKPL